MTRFFGDTQLHWEQIALALGKIQAFEPGRLEEARPSEILFEAIDRARIEADQKAHPEVQEALARIVGRRG